MSPAATQSAPRWERRKDARPAELCAAAMELFIEHGFAATRLEDVAARAGVSKGTLYVYFTDKEDLFKAVVRSGVLPALEDGERLVREFPGSAAELLRLIVRGWWQRLGKTCLSGLPKLMIAEARNFPELARFHNEEVVGRARRMFRAAIERGVASGEFAVQNLDYAVHVLIAPVIMLLVWRHSIGCCVSDDVDPESYLETYLDLALKALRATDNAESK